jgi:hypothetical protein
MHVPGIYESHVSKGHACAQPKTILLPVTLQSIRLEMHLDKDVGHGGHGRDGPAALGRDRLEGRPGVTRIAKYADLQHMLVSAVVIDIYMSACLRGQCGTRSQCVALDALKSACMHTLAICNNTVARLHAGGCQCRT